MSPSAEHRGPGNHIGHDDRPSLHDLLDPKDDRKGAAHEHGRSGDDAPLVEHILDFLDKYPARFVRSASLTGCMGAC